ncbi:alpha/beta hydrolase [Demetria terragena]|uniref:alpha/beta hydrolase n=1 Tax=Demetria terragena TaxID=63959 RepID=UPI0003604075|nr:alpha/beta hydrolase [Demetria terragena]
MSHRHLMPLRTRAFTSAYERTARRDFANFTPEQIAEDRAKVMPTRPPASWVTGAVPDGVTFSTAQIPMRDGTTIRARIARTRSAAAHAPVIIYYHGGGWTLSNPANYDSLTGYLASTLGAVVVGPDYRKAPQDKAPQASFDAYDSLLWVASRPSEVDATGPIAVAGDSAGGNLSAVVSLMARDLEGPTIAGQALIYPATDLTRSHPSSRWREEAVLTGESMDFFLEAYLNEADVTAEDPLVSPLWASSHADLPPCLIQTAECDPLVDEGERYGAILEAAGVPTRVTRYAQMPHGFMSFPGVAPVAAQARSELSRCLRDWLSTSPKTR